MTCWILLLRFICNCRSLSSKSNMFYYCSFLNRLSYSVSFEFSDSNSDWMSSIYFWASWSYCRFSSFNFSISNRYFECWRSVSSEFPAMFPPPTTVELKDWVLLKLAYLYTSMFSCFNFWISRSYSLCSPSIFVFHSSFSLFFSYLCSISAASLSCLNPWIWDSFSYSSSLSFFDHYSDWICSCF